MDHMVATGQWPGLPGWLGWGKFGWLAVPRRRPGQLGHAPPARLRPDLSARGIPRRCGYWARARFFARDGLAWPCGEPRAGDWLPAVCACVRLPGSQYHVGMGLPGFFGG